MHLIIKKTYIFCLLYIDEINEDVDDDNIVDNENNEEEHFQIQSTENDNKYVLVNSIEERNSLSSNALTHSNYHVVVHNDHYDQVHLDRDRFN